MRSLRLVPGAVATGAGCDQNLVFLVKLLGYRRSGKKTVRVYSLPLSTMQTQAAPLSGVLAMFFLPADGAEAEATDVGGE